MRVSVIKALREAKVKEALAAFKGWLQQEEWPLSQALSLSGRPMFSFETKSLSWLG